MALQPQAPRRKSLTDKEVFGVILGFPKPTNEVLDRGRSSGQIMKRTYQASKVRRARTHGFLVRMKTRGGRAVINARRAKGRKRLAV
jgi:large subunit ribosomal protein L34